MDVYGFNPKSLAMGGVQVAAEGDYSSTYYNPALMQQGSFGLGAAYSKPSFFVEATSEPSGAQALSAQLPPDYFGVTFGFTLPIGGKLKDKAALGVIAYLPRSHTLRARLIDEGTGYFFRYDSAPEQLQMVAAVSGRPVEWLWLGAGVQALTTYGGSASFTAVLGTTSAGRVNSRTLDNEVVGAVSPLAGLAVGPFRGVRFFAAWRGEHKASFYMPVGVDLGDFGVIEVTVAGVLHFAPNVVVAGVGARFFDDRLTVGLDVGFEQWSKTPPMVADIGITLPELLTGMGFNKDVVSRPLDMGFTDTFVPRLGLEWKQTDRFSLRGGYCYRPTMVPAQSGRSNFLDADAHLVSAGAAYGFDDPLGWAKRLSLEGAAQLTALNRREVVKEGPNKSLNYRFGGATLNLSVAVRYEF
jgi:hypothetical protein